MRAFAWVAALVLAVVAFAASAHGSGSVSIAAPADCNGFAWVTGGEDGCGPIRLGDDGMGSVELRAEGGETISAWLGGYWVFFSERLPQGYSQTTFSGDVKGRSFTHGQAVMRTADFAVMAGENTIMVDPKGGLVHAHLPVAIYYPGRRITFKLVGLGQLDVVGAVNAWTNLQDNIDLSPQISMVDVLGTDRPAITIEAFDHDTDRNPSTPSPTGWIVISSYN